MSNYNINWVKEWDKEKHRVLKMIWDWLEFIGISIKLYWMHGVVMITGMGAMIKYLNTIPREVSMMEGFFQGELIFLFIGIMMPLVFGFGLRQGRRM